MAFREILGQFPALSILQKDIATGNLSGAYLFIGPAGVGKKMAAVSFAKTLNCQEGSTDSCERCSCCLRIERMNHPNLRIVTPEKDSLRISQIRELKSQVTYRIYEGKKRVWILDGAEKLTLEAANSLLKILEEPPDDLIIILITAIPKLLPSTIISRCRVIQFLPLKTSHLQKLLSKEDNVSAPLVPLISELAQGSMSEALKLIKEKQLFQEREKIFQLLREGVALTQEVLDLSERWSEKESLWLDTLLNMVLFFLRDLLIIKLSSSFSLVNQDKKELLFSLKDRYSFSQLYRGVEAIEKAKTLLRANVSAQLILEWMWMRIFFPEQKGNRLLSG